MKAELALFSVMSANEPTKKNDAPLSRALVCGFRPRRKGKRTVIPTKWDKHRKRLLALRLHLLAERRNHQLTAKEPLEKFSMSMADVATDEFDHNLALSLLSAEQAALYEIDEALSRIKNGTYGICEITGNPIPESRLNAVPWTRFSMDTERRLESTGQIDHVRLGKLQSVTEPSPKN
jgi:DnaK suppressor protein